jgi:hypothetical protein
MTSTSLLLFPPSPQDGFGNRRGERERPRSPLGACSLDEEDRLRRVGESEKFRNDMMKNVCSVSWKLNVLDREKSGTTAFFYYRTQSPVWEILTWLRRKRVGSASKALYQPGHRRKRFLAFLRRRKLIVLGVLLRKTDFHTWWTYDPFVCNPSEMMNLCNLHIGMYAEF